MHESTAPTCLTALENVKAAVQNANISDISVETSLTNTLMGTGGIDKVKKEAKIIFKRYEKLADSYKTGKKISTVSFSPNMKLIMRMIKLAYRKTGNPRNVIIQSDQGAGSTDMFHTSIF